LSGSLLTLSNFTLPLAPTSQPLGTVPLTDRNQPAYGFDDRLRSAYYQNWNVSLQRQITANTIFQARYVANKGTKLVRSASINEVNIFENGVLDAFRTAQAGGRSPLLDQIFGALLPM